MNTINQDFRSEQINNPSAAEDAAVAMMESAAKREEAKLRSNSWRNQLILKLLTLAKRRHH